MQIRLRGSFFQHVFLRFAQSAFLLFVNSLCLTSVFLPHEKSFKFCERLPVLESFHLKCSGLMQRPTLGGIIFDEDVPAVSCCTKIQASQKMEFFARAKRMCQCDHNVLCLFFRFKERNERRDHLHIEAVGKKLSFTKSDFL